MLRQLIEKLGGRLIATYYCFGEYDGNAIAEVPDQATELAVILAAAAPGHIKATKTTALLTMVEAVGR